MKITAVFVTMGRQTIVKDCFAHNMSNCGRPPDEIVWVDNGSTDGTADFARANSDICLLNRKNLGVAHAFNRAFMLANGDLIAQIGAYSKAPDNWLKIMCEVYEAAKPDGVCIYNQPVEIEPGRFRGASEVHAGHTCQPGLFLEGSLFPKSVLDRFGYLDELLDPYWPTDVEYAFRVDHHGFRALAICGLLVVHCGRTKDIEPMMPNPNGSGMMPYYAWKQAVQWRTEVLARIDENAKNGYPKFGFNQLPQP